MRCTLSSRPACWIRSSSLRCRLKSAAHSIRLLIDFFNGEVSIAAFLCCLCIPLNGQRVTLYQRAIEFGQRNATRAQRNHLAFIDDNDAARMVEDGRDVRGQELLILTQTDDEWATAVTGADQQVGLLAADHSNSVGAGDALQGEPHRPFKIVL